MDQRLQIGETHVVGHTGSLPDLKNRSEKLTGREQIITILTANSCFIDGESGEI
ncbi:MAG: hypothetical protein ABIT23_05325 [Nitrosospira sp.]